MVCIQCCHIKERTILISTMVSRYFFYFYCSVAVFSLIFSLLTAYEQCASEGEKEKLLSSIRYGKLKRFVENAVLWFNTFLCWTRSEITKRSKMNGLFSPRKCLYQRCPVKALCTTLNASELDNDLIN